MPSTPHDMMTAMLANLEEKTGHGMDHWFSVVEKSGEEKHMAIIKHLKSEHGLTHGYANLIAMKFRQRFESPKSETDLVSAQYAGAKAGLKPIYDQLVDMVKSLGDDVDVSPRKTYVTIRRSKQFAIFKASTKERLDVGFVLKGVEPTDRLRGGKQFSGMMTHAVGVSDASEIDDELKVWLKQAYEAA